ncbi:MAG: glycosyl transferase family 1 [Bacteroidetes bacterium]|nr:glycosyl transferase family 1 [Bacteroidota bacterium]
MPNAAKNHVLVVAYYFPPMGLSGVQRIAKLVKYLPENGWRVTVLTPESASYFAFDDGLLEELEANPEINIVRTSSLDPTRIRTRENRSTISFPEERSRRLLSNLSQWLLLPDNKIGWKRFATKKALELHASDPFELVYTTAPPYTCFLIGAEVARKTGRPLVVDYRDDWVGNPRHTYPTSWHRKKTTNLERMVLGLSSQVFAINQTILNAVKSRNPHDNCSYSVVPQGFDPADFEGAETTAASLSGPRMTFLYAGMFYDAQQPDSFLQAAQLLFAKRPELKSQIRFRFIGIFPESKRALIHQLGLDSVVELIGYVDHKSTIKELLGCDVAWMIIGRQKGEKMISTGKLFEYMGSLKPVLALVPDGEAKQALNGYKAEFVVNPDAIPSISETIEKLFETWQLGALPIGDQSHVKQFNRKLQAALIASEFTAIIS